MHTGDASTPRTDAAAHEDGAAREDAAGREDAAARPVRLPRFPRLLPWMLDGQRAVGMLVLLLVIGDVAFVVIHVIAALRGMPDPMLYVSTDRGYAEVVQYLKFIYVIVLLGWCALERRSIPIALAAMPFGYLLLDDSFQVHERGGAWLDRRFEFPWVAGVRGQEFGELLVTASVAVVLLLILVPAYLLAKRVDRWIYRMLLGLLVVLAAFGLVLDVVNVVVAPILAPLLGSIDWVAIVEDGGELVVVSLIAAFVLRLNVRDGRTGLPLPGELAPAMNDGRAVA